MQLRAALEAQVEGGSKDLDVLGWMGRTALELIGRGGLGYSFDPLVTESREVFTESVKSLVFVLYAYILLTGENSLTCGVHSSPVSNDVIWTREITPYLSYLGPAWLRRFLLHFVPIPKIQRLKTVTDVLTKRTEEIYYAKKAAIERGDEELLHALGEGKDIMSVLREFTCICPVFQAITGSWRL